MIRINLLGVPREVARSGPMLDLAQRVTIGCGLVLAVTVAGLGWWAWSLHQSKAQLDADLVSAREETQRLKSILTEVQTFEARRKQLQQRVALIEQLRQGQSVPVQMLDLVSRNLPEMMWLTQLAQKDAELTLEGRSNTLIALSDFVGNLAGNAFFKKPIEIVDSQVETAAPGSSTGPTADLIRFTVKAQLATASTPPAPAPTAAAPAARQ